MFLLNDRWAGDGADLTYVAGAPQPTRKLAEKKFLALNVREGRAIMILERTGVMTDADILREERA